MYARCLNGNSEVDLVYRRVRELELSIPDLTTACLDHNILLINALEISAGAERPVFLRAPGMIKTCLV